MPHTAPDDIVNNEQLLASAIAYLLQGGNKEEALLLLASEIERVERWEENPGSTESFARLYLRGPRRLCEIMDYGNRDLELLRDNINSAFSSTIRGPYVRLDVGFKLVDLTADWRTVMLSEADTAYVRNQANYEINPVVYSDMRFSSEAEVKIARALDSVGAMYIPNCLVRVGTPTERKNRFPDFLICFRGKWGLLEVDGRHHIGRKAEDNERMRLIERHGGIAYTTSYDAVRCMREPDVVVKQFLEILGTK